MTIHEAIDQLKSLLDHCKTMRESGEVWVRDCEALRIAIAALRSPTREQVEKVWRGEWKVIGADKRGRHGIPYCMRCEKCNPYKSEFCPHCGAPMTDEAVEIVIKRLEALNEIPTAT